MLLEPVAWSCFWILASKDASRISMVMVGSLGLRVRERVGWINKIPGGMGPWNPTSRKVREAWGCLHSGLISGGTYLASNCLI
jgi:hypothetical protein